MTSDVDPRIVSSDSPAAAGMAWARAPWLFVVARGHARLMAELEAMFRHDPRVRVIENRREDHGLLPRSATLTHYGFPAGLAHWPAVPSTDGAAPSGSTRESPERRGAHPQPA